MFEKVKINFVTTIIVNCFEKVQDKHFIADLLKEIIDEVGHMNIQVINS